MGDEFDNTRARFSFTGEGETSSPRRRLRARVTAVSLGLWDAGPVADQDAGIDCDSLNEWVSASESVSASDDPGRRDAEDDATDERRGCCIRGKGSGDSSFCGTCWEVDLTFLGVTNGLPCERDGVDMVSESTSRPNARSLPLRLTGEKGLDVGSVDSVFTARGLGLDMALVEADGRGRDFGGVEGRSDGLGNEAVLLAMEGVPCLESFL